MKAISARWIDRAHFVVILSMLMWFGQLAQCLGQAKKLTPTPTPIVEAAPAQNTSGGNPSLFDKLSKWFDGTAAMATSLTSLVVALTAFLVALSKWKEAKLAKAEAKETREFVGGAIIREVPDAWKSPKEEMDYQICLFGPGSSGKTTFIRLISQNPTANPAQSTGGIKTYGFSQTNYHPGRWESIRYIIDDYPGQNPGTIAVAPSLSVIPDGATARAGAAIFMLDICATIPETGVPDEAEGYRMNAGGTHSAKRIKEHIEMWSKNGLSHLQAHLRGRVKFNYCCFFINKIDLAETWSSAEETAVKEAFKPLIDTVKAYPLFHRDCTHDVVFGTLAVDPAQLAKGPKRRDRLAVGCNLPFVWARLTESARSAYRDAQTKTIPT